MRNILAAVSMAAVAACASAGGGKMTGVQQQPFREAVMQLRQPFGEPLPIVGRQVAEGAGQDHEAIEIRTGGCGEARCIGQRRLGQGLVRAGKCVARSRLARVAAAGQT